MINSVKFYSPAFGQRYVNYDGSTVNVSEEAIKQAERQLYIRKSVEKSIEESNDLEMKTGDVFFTMFSDGSCHLSKKEVYPFCKGRALNIRNNTNDWKAAEVYAYGIRSDFMSSDELGSVRQDGIGMKFAYLYPEGDIYMHKYAEEYFPEK